MRPSDGHAGDAKRDLDIAQELADQIRSTDAGMTCRKVTTLLDRFGAYRLTPEVRHRIAGALADVEVQVKPPIDEVQRFETVRLSIGLDDGEDGGRTRTMSHVVPVAEALRVTAWGTGECSRERALFDVAPVDGVLWVDV